MLRPLFALLALACAVRAEIRTMTLRQAVETALRQNPDIELSRLDEDKARQGIRSARDPFYPRVVVGSGLAYSSGFPMSIDGAAPSVIQAQARAYVFNRPQSYQIAVARENARGAALATNSKRDDVAYRIASLYVDAQRAVRVLEIARRDVDSQQKVLDTVQAQVREGRALPLAEKQAALNVARAREVVVTLEDAEVAAESSLAVGLGLPAEDRVRPADEQRTAPVLPESEDRAVATALELNKELRHLESEIVSKQLEIRGARAARLPRLDLVAQYGMLAKFNNYDEFFKAFQRNNGQIGISFQIPLLAGPGISAQSAEAQADIAHLKIELTSLRNRIVSDLQQSFRDLRKTETSGEVARLDLDVAREQLSVDLAQMQEGRLGLRQVEEARVVEDQKWISFYDAQFAIEKARWNVLRLTGSLVGAIEGGPDRP
jgi:outer membrane protein TolC